MKRKYLIIILILSILPFGFTCYSQSSELSVEVEILDGSPAGTNDLLVRVESKHPGYTYLLYDEDPLMGNQPIRAEYNVPGNEFVFNGLTPATYNVCVLDRKENLACKKIEIE